MSLTGSDEAPGTVAKPFATLERARQAVRETLAAGVPLGGIVVWIREGVYERSATFELGAQDSGTDGSPVEWCGYPGEQVRLVGGRRLDPSSFSAVTSASPVWGRLDESARGNLLQIDLAAHGITQYGTLASRASGGNGHSALELFVDGAPMQLARWPDASQDDPKPDVLASNVTVFGNPTPDVTGTYGKIGEQDGVSSFRRNDLVGGKQYYLYRCTWDYPAGTTHTAWFLTTQESGYPSNADPWWYLYSDGVGKLSPANGAAGNPSTDDPSLVNHGFATLVAPVLPNSFAYVGDRPSRWTNLTDVWFHGYWKYFWSDAHVAVTAIDTGRHVITLANTPSSYGIEAGQAYYAYNLLEEITVPGEWYLDRQAGMLYLWPPSTPLSSDLFVSLLDGPLIRMDNASFVAFRDMTLEDTWTELVNIQGGEHDLLDGLTLRNAGTSAVVVSGTGHLVRYCEILGSGAGGVRITGGDRGSLTPGGNAVEDCHIHHFGRWVRTYQPAVSLAGVGNVARNNLVHDAPHSAFLFSGNEHTIELNEIHHVCFSTSDAGAIYSGRDWGFRGNVIRNNFIHHIDTYFGGYGVHGIYLDDCLSGIRVEGNVLYAVSGLGIEHGGGRDNIMVNNVIAKCGTGLGADSRGKDWRGLNNTPGDSWNLLEKLQKVGYQDEPWKSRYPECAAIPNSWDAIIDPNASWLYPEGCVFSRNIGFQNKNWISASGVTTEKYKEIADNIPNQDPLFVDEANLNLTLRSDSPALKSIPGFQPIPFGNIGIRR